MENHQVKILLVEDEAIVAQYLCLELKMEGFSVCGFVASGEEAVVKAKEDDPSIILMDINLVGEIDGIEAARQIHEYKKIPIVFMTGYSRLEFAERVAAVNPIGYFNKPVEVSMIKQIIDKIFN